MTDEGNPTYKFSLSVSASNDIMKRVVKVRYDFDPELFHFGHLESQERSTGFGTSYNGWGCAKSVTVTLTFEQGSEPAKFAFDMCSALGW